MLADFDRYQFYCGHTRIVLHGEYLSWLADGHSCRAIHYVLDLTFLVKESIVLYPQLRPLRWGFLGVVDNYVVDSGPHTLATFSSLSIAAVSPKA